MEVTLPLQQMSTADKLRLLEEIWADLRRHEDELDSPAWHEQALRERDERVAAGKESYVDWEAAKTQLRQRHS